jgi:hypothetical protein
MPSDPGEQWTSEMEEVKKHKQAEALGCHSRQEVKVSRTGKG